MGFWFKNDNGFIKISINVLKREFVGPRASVHFIWKQPADQPTNCPEQIRFKRPSYESGRSSKNY